MAESTICPPTEIKTQDHRRLPPEDSVKVDQASTVASPLNILWNMTAVAQRWWYAPKKVSTEDFLQRFNAMGLSPAQQLSHLLEHATLGWNLKEPVSEGAFAFYKGLLEEGETGELKVDFQPYFGFMVQVAKINSWHDLILALHQPDKPEHQVIIGAFRDALRIDSTYLQEVTERKIASPSLSFEEKMVHLHFFLSTHGVEQGRAAEVLAKLPPEQQAQLRDAEEWGAVIVKEVDQLRDQVAPLRTPLAMCQVIRSFQETFQNITVLALYDQLDEEGTKVPIRAFQGQVMAEMDIAGSRIIVPGTKTGGYVFGFGATTFDYITKEQDPSGAIAKGAISKMIDQLSA